VIAKSSPALYPPHMDFILKHEAKFIMNQSLVDHNVEEWEGYYSYSSIMGWKLCLLTAVSRHNFSPTIEE